MGNACNMGVNLHVICQFWDGPERSGMYVFDTALLFSKLAGLNSVTSS